MKAKQILNGIFYTPALIVQLIANRLKQLNWDYDVIVDNAAGAAIMAQIDPKVKFIGIDLNGQDPLIRANSLLKCDWRTKLALNRQKLLIATNPPYCNLQSFYQNKLKQQQSIAIDPLFKSSDLGISFFKTYYYNWNADYVIALIPLAYFLKASKLKQMQWWWEHYQLVDQQIISSAHFEHLKQKSHFPIMIGYWKKRRLVEKIAFEQLQQWVEQYPWSIYDIDLNYQYDVQFGQFKDLRIQNYWTKYPNKKLNLDHYNHFWTLRDINWLAINQTWVATERPQTIRIASEVVDHFRQLDRFKKWWNGGGKKQFWWLGNYDPIVIWDEDISQSILKRIKNADHKG